MRLLSVQIFKTDVETNQDVENDKGVLIDGKFASGITNINFGFTLTMMCVSTVYSILRL